MIIERNDVALGVRVRANHVGNAVGLRMPATLDALPASFRVGKHADGGAGDLDDAIGLFLR